MAKQKKVFVSGCYDLLHSGHVAFFKEASQHGLLYVGIGSDQTVFDLKGRRPVNSEKERLYMVSAIRYVEKAWINSGSGPIDFKEDLIQLSPDILMVNEDGHSLEKEQLCKKLGIEYIVSKRIPEEGLPQRSTTELRKICNIPYRIDLAGGWLDQPFVSKYHPGAVLTISIEPTYNFNDRSGMSTSTRKKAIELWKTDLPEGDLEKIAKVLFTYENEPGREYVSGSQDAIGIVYPGLNKLNYQGGAYWPTPIESITDEEHLQWLEKRLYLLTLKPRHQQMEILSNLNINEKDAKALAMAADDMWEGLKNRDSQLAGSAMTRSFEAQIKMFPNMVTEEVLEAIETVQDQVLGYKLSGAGGGGYLVLFSETPIPNTLQIKIRRK